MLNSNLVIRNKAITIRIDITFWFCSRSCIYCRAVLNFCRHIHLQHWREGFILSSTSSSQKWSHTRSLLAWHILQMILDPWWSQNLQLLKDYPYQTTLSIWSCHRPDSRSSLGNWVSNRWGLWWRPGIGSAGGRLPGRLQVLSTWTLITVNDYKSVTRTVPININEWQEFLFFNSSK